MPIWTSSDSTKAGADCGRLTTKVLSSGAAKLVPAGNRPPCAFCGSLRARSKLSSTSAEVSSEPSENLRPERSLKVKDVESSLASQDSAAAPSMPVASRLLRTSARLTRGHAQMLGLLLL